MSSIEGKRSAILEVAIPELGGLRSGALGLPQWFLVIEYERDSPAISVGIQCKAKTVNAVRLPACSCVQIEVSSLHNHL